MLQLKSRGQDYTLTKATQLEPKSSKSISDKIEDLDKAQLAKLSKFIDKQ